ncbi:Sodium/proline symporter [Nitrosococcus oceani ATCC 19707]|uniref:Sodium/proline symporter n=2 Tax=Nitrosococcus oceani TaxID=1229 RepID=Q3JAU2_NITOC|nr:sodium/proline symporter PutP [Nitrosococcus oceani]ABA58054.1 Sodium/proline symporter [Nitrosococcus oceani ATCC 19707]EDZ66823.1 sodium/proline symporter [Nitrosococcus oceani AFC27]KFI19527.1 proline:sodium symporter PutP [Nitrosococcus oceani C-27]GEM20976.1 sodium:proline symporter [Nitrosococcus oceani]
MIVTFIIYLAVMLLLGLLAYVRTRDLSDYILGGRKLGSWTTALSAGASDMSGWLLLGLPGYAYLHGLEAGWIALGLWLGTYGNWRLVAARLRAYSTAAGDSLTLPEFLAQRFHDHRHLLRCVAAAFILIFFLFYTSAGLVAGGKLFNAVFGLPYTWAVTAGTLAIMSYTFVGGFLAVSWTDLVQGLLMLLALLAVPVVAILHLGGWQATLAGIDAERLYLFVATTDEPLGAIAILSLLGWGLGYFGQPHIQVRFMAIHSLNAVPQARRIAMGWVTLTLIGALLVGITGASFLHPPLSTADSEKVFIEMVSILFHPLPAGVLLAAILAAIMSTTDSQLLVCSAVFTDDFYKALLRHQASARELVYVSRATVVIIASLALWLALDPESQVLELVAYAWAGFGAAFGPTLLMALYWKRMTRQGALAGIIVGGMTILLWKQLNGGIFDLYELVPGFIFSAIAIVGASLLSTAPGIEIERQFNAIANNTKPFNTNNNTEDRQT